MNEVLAHFARCDQTLYDLAVAVGPLEEPEQQAGFAALVRVIIGQQVSTAAAAALERRAAACLRAWEPAVWLAQGEETLRATGLSRAKIAAITDLATRWIDGRFAEEQLRVLDDAAATAYLVQVRGIGRWTAENYLMHALGRRDILPAGDLGLRDAVRLAYRLAELPGEAELRRLAERWKPYRTYAAWYLWRARRELLTRA